jgi:flagellar biosynthetic protein FliQ
VTDSTVLGIFARMMLTTAEVSAPILLVSLAVGLAISLLQSVTQIQEVTLTFVPKLIGVALVILFAGHWMLDTLVSYTDQLFQTIPQLISA